MSGDLIERKKALNFETAIDAAPEDIPKISRGMAIYAEHIKHLPTVQIRKGVNVTLAFLTFIIGALVGSVLTVAYMALFRSAK